MEQLIKYNIRFDGEIEPDYNTSYCYEFKNKHVSFKELFIELGDNCVKYIELEGGWPSADFYIKNTFNIDLLIKKYNYLIIS